MNESILTSVKKMLGITEEYEHFDPDLIIHINSVFMLLRQLGVGPAKGYHITDESNKWSEFLQDSTELEMVKSYMYLRVRLLFDPPSGGVQEAINNQIKEFEWRLNVAVDPEDTFYEGN